MTPRGLGNAEDPFARRERAAEAFLPPPPPPDDDDDEVVHQEEQIASNAASNTASIDQESSADVTELTNGGLPPPPPAREPIARVQFNQRIRSDRRKVLDRYRRKHGSTWQAVFDQMVDEYMIRRDLLPKGDDIE